MIKAKHWILLLALCLPRAAVAQSEDALFEVAVMGVQAGALRLATTRDGTTYTVRAEIESAGVARLLRRVRFEAASRGTASKGRYAPARYTESADTGQRQSEVELSYAKGMPRIVSYAPAPDSDTPLVDQGQLGGTIDPATALFAALRDQPADQACSLSARTFDGRRLAQLTLSGAKADGDGLRCQGEYRRLQGFTPAEMADKQRFPFTLTYAPTSDGLLRVTQVRLDTIFGKATLTRR